MGKMKKMKFILATVVIALAMTSCYTVEHTVGSGAKGNTKIEKKQWYALYGAIPLNHVDSKEMAGGETNYNIKTQVKFVDYIITAFTSYVTIVVQTVEVQK
jgi:hypothetical protein